MVSFIEPFPYKRESRTYENNLDPAGVYPDENLGMKDRPEYPTFRTVFK